MICNVLDAVLYLQSTIPYRESITKRARQMIDDARASNHDDVDIVMAAMETIASDLGNYLCDRLGTNYIMMAFPNSVSDKLVKVMSVSDQDKARNIIDHWRKSRTDAKLDIVASMLIIYACIESRMPKDVM